MRASPLAMSLLLSLPLAGLAQDTSGSLNGLVLDSAGIPIRAAEVTVGGPSLQGNRSTATSTDGSFLVSALPVGTYRVIVRLGRTTTVGAVALTESPVQLDPIEARAERPLIDPVSTAGGVNLTPELYDNLPVSRDYLGMVTLLP